MSAAEQLPPVAWRTAVGAAAKQFGYGEVISHEWLRAAFELAKPRTAFEQKRYETAFLSSFVPFRRALRREHRKRLHTDRHGGYVVLAVADHVRVCVEDRRTAVDKAMRELRLDLRHAPVDLMTDAQRKELADAQAKAAAARSMYRKSWRTPKAASPKASE